MLQIKYDAVTNHCLFRKLFIYCKIRNPFIVPIFSATINGGNIHVTIEKKYLTFNIMKYTSPKVLEYAMDFAFLLQQMHHSKFPYPVFFGFFDSSMVFVGNDGRARILGYSNIHYHKSGEKLKIDPRVLKNIKVIAPEMREGWVGPLTDVFYFGVLFWCMVTGKTEEHFDIKNPRKYISETCIPFVFNRVILPCFLDYEKRPSSFQLFFQLKEFIPARDFNHSVFTYCPNILGSFLHPETCSEYFDDIHASCCCKDRPNLFYKAYHGKLHEIKRFPNLLNAHLYEAAILGNHSAVIEYLLSQKIPMPVTNYEFMFSIAEVIDETMFNLMIQRVKLSPEDYFRIFIMQLLLENLDVCKKLSEIFLDEWKKLSCFTDVIDSLYVYYGQLDDLNRLKFLHDAKIFPSDLRRIKPEISCLEVTRFLEDHFGIAQGLMELRKVSKIQ